jgi:hypothetical protein
MQGNNKGKTVIKKISINAPIHHSPIISERVSRILISKVRARLIKLNKQIALTSYLNHS